MKWSGELLTIGILVLTLTLILITQITVHPHSYDVFKMCNGDGNENTKQRLDETVHSHIAIVVSSLAHLERLKEMRPSSVRDCVGTAGFGIGEITSLIFAGALQLEQGNITTFKLRFFSKVKSHFPSVFE